MNPRLAAVVLIGFIAALVFVGWLITQRRARNAELLSSQRARIGEYQERVQRYQGVLDKIQEIAQPATDIDPSAELILMEITRFKQKELS
jgi:type II secretory pathway pseudopilin PulG